MLLLCLPITNIRVLHTVTWLKHDNCPPSHVHTSLRTTTMFPAGYHSRIIHFASTAPVVIHDTGGALSVLGLLWALLGNIL